jgi:hypothetical protein
VRNVSNAVYSSGRYASPQRRLTDWLSDYYSSSQANFSSIFFIFFFVIAFFFHELA